MQRGRPLALTFALAAFGLALLPASAGAASVSNLFGKTYCEVIALRGESPNVTATVYNTVAFNPCRLPWWRSLDPEAIADQLDASSVILNGPRYWVFDRATAPGVPSVIEIDGQGLAEVATIELGDEPLAPSIYTERTILRDNRWRWKPHRRIYELVAPDGTLYVMQSFTRNIDPTLHRRDFRKLGEKLALPDGWTFRSRKLKKPFVLDSDGAATITQDDLLGTYQRVDGEPPAAQPRAGAR